MKIREEEEEKRPTPAPPCLQPKTISRSRSYGLSLFMDRVLITVKLQFLGEVSILLSTPPSHTRTQERGLDTKSGPMSFVLSVSFARICTITGIRGTNKDRVPRIRRMFWIVFRRLLCGWRDHIPGGLIPREEYKALLLIELPYLLSHLYALP